MSYEIRDPIHGFIKISELERDIINHPAFQRLRRIRQLALTDLVYPGAMHTRFEHSLGVMHVATRLFNSLIEKKRNREILKSDYGFEDGGIERQRKLIRLAALLHDLGHAPFSHAAEELLPENTQTRESYQHEDYTAAILQGELAALIDGHRGSKPLGLKTSEILQIFSGKPQGPNPLVWKNLVAGQMDADRMDYLLRDSYHVGVQYGRYDLDRIINTVELCADPELGGHQIGINDGGIQAAEGLIVARYMMFSQVYFHKTRVIYDHHLVECLKEILGRLPAPNNLSDYMSWNDWKVLGAIADGKGGIHGEYIKNRDHYRLCHETSPIATPEQIELLEEIESTLSARNIPHVQRDAGKSWYKPGASDILVVHENSTHSNVRPLSHLSSVVSALKETNQKRLYVPKQHLDAAKKIVRTLSRSETDENS